MLKALNFRLLHKFSESEVYFTKAAELYKKAKHPLGIAVVERYRGRMLTVWDKKKRQKGKQVLRNSVEELKFLGTKEELDYTYICLVDKNIALVKKALRLKYDKYIEQKLNF